VAAKNVAAKDVAARLASVPIFAGCTKKELAAIGRVVKIVEHAAGTAVAAEGEPGAGLFVIDTGTADVTVGGKTVNRLKAGDFFGEMALLDGGPRTATVTATSDIRMFALTEWVFRGLLSEHPSIALHTLEALAARLRGVASGDTD
jgi:CRP-like cAMP-binding protein